MMLPLGVLAFLPFLVGSQTITSQYGCATVNGGYYTLCNNLWDLQDYPSGTQTTTYQGGSGSQASWSTTYNWGGSSSQVHSYANLGLVTGLPIQLSKVASMPTNWAWSYTSTSSGLVADVSWDLWLSSSSSGGVATTTSSYEIMIWLSGKNCQPAGGQIASGIQIGGHTWNLWRGNVQNWVDYSFVITSETTNFSGDLMDFFQYLVNNQGVPSNHYVVGMQMGTEAFIGQASITMSQYSLSIQAGTRSTTSATGSHTTSSSGGGGGGSCAALYGQCGGIGFTGATCCSSGTCKVGNPYYSQCLP